MGPRAAATAAAAAAAAAGGAATESSSTCGSCMHAHTCMPPRLCIFASKTQSVKALPPPALPPPSLPLQPAPRLSH
jgi:hypothetical protein